MDIKNVDKTTKNVLCNIGDTKYFLQDYFFIFYMLMWNYVVFFVYTAHLRDKNQIWRKGL